MSKVCVTGAAGYIGSRVYHDLKKSHTVVPIDNLSLSKASIPELVNIDIKDLEDLEPKIKKCDAVFHLAAFPGLDNCKENPDLAYKTNIIGTQNISYLCYKYEIPLIFVSSMAVYGDPQSFPIKETHPKDPQNFYALNKYLGMRIVESFSKNNFPSYVFILCNVYGTHQLNGQTINKPRTVVNKFLLRAKKDKPLTIFSPGDQARNFIHVKDVSSAFLHALPKLVKDSKKTRLFNLSHSSYSVQEIASLIKKAKPDVQIKKIPNPRDSETLVKSFQVDSSKIKNYLNFQPKISLPQYIQDSLNLKE